MKKWSGLRWWVIGLVAFATLINYIDRGALAIMWPEMSKDLGLGKDDYAQIAILFTVAYAVSQSLSGRLYDKVGTRMGFVLSISLWSLAVALHAAARNVFSFAAFRFLLGLGEAGNWPGAVKSNAEWFPVKERALAQGIFNSGASVGSIISPLLVAAMYLSMGWQTTFVLLGGLGMLWVVPWLLINRALPGKHPWITEEEKALILAGTEEPAPDAAPAPSAARLLGTKKTWAVLGSRFFLDPIWWLFVFWLPIYLAEQFGFDVKKIGMFAWVPYVGAAVGSIAGGWFAGKLISRGMAVWKARRFAVTLGGAIMLPTLILCAYASGPLAAVLLISTILFGFQVAISNIQTLPSDLFDGRSVASVAGMGGTTAAIGVGITTWIVPLITKVNYEAFFLLGAALVPLGVACVYFFDGGEKEAVEETTTETSGAVPPLATDAG